MESIEAILKMNEKHPPGRRSRCIDDLCARVEELEKALSEEQARQPAPAPNPAPLTQAATHDAPTAAEARSEALSVSSVRAIAARGDPVTAEQVLALCHEVERWQRQASLWADNIEDLTRERDGLLACARAWAGAIERVDGVVAAEQELLKAIRDMG